MPKKTIPPSIAGPGENGAATYLHMKGFRALLILLGAVGPMTVAMLFGVFASKGLEALSAPGLREVANAVWSPALGAFGLLPLMGATLVLALLATVLSAILGLPAAVRLAFLASETERRLCEASLTLLAGLPSVIIGVVGLFCIVPWSGFSVFAAVITLAAMSWPTYTLLLLAALRQEGATLFDATCALGIPQRTAAYRVALLAVRSMHLRIGARILAKACGEATAVSFVIGNIAHTGHLPTLFEPAHTVTSMILKDHGAAAGEHLTAVYAAAFLLGGLVLLINFAGGAVARRLEY